MNAPIRLVQFTDSHLYADPDGLLRGTPTLASLKATLAHARTTCGYWDATLLTGDLVQDDPGGYVHVREVFGGFLQPVYCLPGNHDEPVAMRRELASRPFQVDGHADLGDWLLVMLDSCVEGAAKGALGADELGRLEALLSARTHQHALVCLHHQPVRMGSKWLDQVGLTNADELFAVVERHASVRALVWGHVHQAYEGRRGDVSLFGTPSTCAQFKPLVDGFAIDRRPPGYRWLELEPNGLIRTAVEWLHEQPLELRAQTA